MALTIQDAINQNTVGYSEGTPSGVPTGFGWYGGVYKVTPTAPTGFTSVTAWGQVYQDSGEPVNATASAKVQVANSKTYVHLRSTGDWVLVQDQPKTGVAGGHYLANFSGNSAMSMPVTNSSDGVATFAAPPSGYNDHFWPTARGTFAANDVDAVYVQMDMRVTDPNVNLTAQIGADWWLSSTAPFVQGFSNNPTAGTGNWVDLSTEWRTLAYYSNEAVFKADPPPTLVGGTVPVEVRPTITSFSPDSATAGDGLTNASAVTLNGTAKAGTRVAVFDGTAQIGTATATANGTWTYTTGQLQNASHAFTVKNLSSSGTLGLASSALTVKVDTIAPATPKVVSFSPDSDTVGDGVTTATRLTLAGTAEAGSAIKVFDGTAQIGTATANANGQWSLTTGTLSNATHSFSASATDAAGNSSGRSLPLSVKVQGSTSTQPPTTTPDGTNLLVNGSFESATVAAGQWAGYKTMAGWTALSGSTIELWNNTNGVQASNGSNFGELDYLSGADGFYQSVQTVAGQSYKLSFDARSRPGVNASTCTIEVLWNDKVVASVPPGANWSSYNFNVTGTGGQDRLTFREVSGQGGDGLGALYDNIALTTSAAPPPPPVSGTNLLVNGSFEATSLASGQWGGFATVQGWSAISGSTIELWNNLNGVKASNGQNFGELDYLSAPDGLYQTVKTDAGQKYTLSFDARSRLGTTAATTTIDVLWNDKVVASVPPGSNWSTYTFSVTGTGGQDRLTFREAAGQGGDGLGALYDNVSLVATGSATSSTMAALDQSMTLMTQYSASAADTSSIASNTVFQGVNQDSTAPTLTQTH